MRRPAAAGAGAGLLLFLWLAVLLVPVHMLVARGLGVMEGLVLRVRVGVRVAEGVLEGVRVRVGEGEGVRVAAVVPAGVVRITEGLPLGRHRGEPGDGGGLLVRRALLVACPRYKAGAQGGSPSTDAACGARGSGGCGAGQFEHGQSGDGDHRDVPTCLHVRLGLPLLVVVEAPVLLHGAPQGHQVLGVPWVVHKHQGWRPHALLLHMVWPARGCT